jgi:hypothetical protein
VLPLRYFTDANHPVCSGLYRRPEGENNGNADFHKGIETWAELQQMLAVAGWHFTQGNKTFFPPGFSIVAASRTTPAGVCATRLKDLLDSLSVSPATVHFDSSAPILSQCPPDDNCVEVTVGKLETP